MHCWAVRRGRAALLLSSGTTPRCNKYWNVAQGVQQQLLVLEGIREGGYCSGCLVMLQCCMLSVIYISTCPASHGHSLAAANCVCDSPQTRATLTAEQHCPPTSRQIRDVSWLPLTSPVLPGSHQDSFASTSHRDVLRAGRPDLLLKHWVGVQTT
jgi:hypothetical protein